MTERPLGSTLLALLLGLHASVAGTLVLRTIVLLEDRPPVGFLLLDLVVVISSGCTAFGAWRRAAWSAISFVVLAGGLIAVAWAHLIAADTALGIRELGLGLGGTTLLLGVAAIGYRYLDRVARASA